jgi:hypothetical protein
MARNYASHEPESILDDLDQELRISARVADLMCSYLEVEQERRSRGDPKAVAKSVFLDQLPGQEDRDRLSLDLATIDFLLALKFSESEQSPSP